MSSDHAPAGADTRFFGHPLGLATLFFTEMFERFSYYGMRALLILYMTHKVAEGGLGFVDAKAGSIYGLYTAMVYLLCLAGGWIADTFIGQRRAVLAGGILIAAGEFCLLAPGELPFYAGLVLLMMGTGLLKGNVSTIVGQLYPAGDPRRDSGFTIFYMGINSGAVVAPIVCGWLGQHYGYRLGFGVAGLGMFLGLAQYVAFGRSLGDAGSRPAGAGSPEATRRRKRFGLLAGLAVVAIAGGCAALGASGTVSITPQSISNALGYFLLLVTRGGVLLADPGKGMVAGGTQAVHRGAGSVRFLGGFLVRARTGRQFAQPVRRPRHPLRRPGRGVSVQLVPDRGTGIRGGAGIGVCLAVAGAGPPRPIQPREILARASFQRGFVRYPDTGGGHHRRRHTGLRAVPAGHVFPAGAGGTLAGSGGPERGEQAGAGARRRLHDGDLVPLHQHRQLAGREGRLAVQFRAPAASVRLRGGLQPGRRGGHGAA